VWVKRLLPILLVAALGGGAFVVLASLEDRADRAREAQVDLGKLRAALWQTDIAAWNANHDVGGNPRVAGQAIDTGESTIAQIIGELDRGSPVPPLGQLTSRLRANYDVTRRIFDFGRSHGYGASINWLTAPQNSTKAHVFSILDEADRDYARQAGDARELAIAGSAGVILALLTAFFAVWWRSVRARIVAERLAAENARLAAANREEAVTDALTGLRNRRALIDDLMVAVSAASSERPALLALFDLDGFKQYNDTFGHQAGDDLLAGLGTALASACTGLATAYRLGGDEFCVLAPDLDGDGRELVAAATAALSASGERWSIGCSAGVVKIPRQAGTATEALRLADVNMYAHKAARAAKLAA
jgi:diguanylate cyclase (GGDEF)-like protein